MQALEAPLPTKCACGAEISADHLALVEFFPKLLRPRQCELCHYRELQDQQERINLQRAADEMTRRREHLSAIPPEMRRSTISHPEFNPGLWLRVEHWTPANVTWLGIVGGPGECKTRCLALLAMRLILDHGHRFKWTTAVDFQDEVDKSLNGERGDMRIANEYFTACKTAEILVLDDFGKNTWNPTTERRLFSVIDYRKTHDLPILWTSNTEPLEILASGVLSKDRGAPLIGRMLEISKIERV